MSPGDRKACVCGTVCEAHHNGSVCSTCKKKYHADCVTARSKGDWVCGLCQMAEVLQMVYTRCCLILLISAGQHCAQRCREKSRHSRHHLAAIFRGQRTRRPSHAGSSFMEAFANSKHAKMFYMANWVSQSANTAVEISDDGSTHSIHLIHVFFFYSCAGEERE